VLARAVNTSPGSCAGGGGGLPTSALQLGLALHERLNLVLQVHVLGGGSRDMPADATSDENQVAQQPKLGRASWGADDVQQSCNQGRCGVSKGRPATGC
jgi:hypothetical protein